MAAIHGVSLDGEGDDSKAGGRDAPVTVVAPAMRPKKDAWFKHPDEYAHLSQEEKEKLTERMMMMHKMRVQDLRKKGALSI